MKTVNLILSKELKEAGYPQEDSSFYWVEKGQKYGDGYGNTAGGLTEEMLVCTAKPQGFLADGSRSDTPNSYNGEIEFLAVKVGEYGDDNYFDYPVSCASPTADEILDRLPKGLGVAKNNVGYSICLLDESWRKIIGLSNRELYEYAMDLTAADTLAKMWLYLKKEGLLG